MTSPTSLDLLAAYTTTEFQVWVKTPQGGFYAYRTDLVYSVARTWAEAWDVTTGENPADVPAGSSFIAIEATTSFKVA